MHLSYNLRLLERGIKKAKKNRYNFSEIRDGQLLRFLPNVVYVACSSEMSEQSDSIIWYKIPKGGHDQNKRY
jgi:hypothetical protein